jgi:carbon starvation protein
MAQIFSRTINGRWLDLWYHFAIMFEALFILTTIDAGTRVGRYLLQDVLGRIWKPLGDTRELRANLSASFLMVSAWGYFLIQGVRDPLGGINSLWPLFGIANQMLAAIGLCLATTVILKMGLVGAGSGSSAQTLKPQSRGPAMALITFVPLVWLIAVTMTAGGQKIWNADPRIGFLAQVKVLEGQQPALQQALEAAKGGGNKDAIVAAEKALQTNRILCFNNRLDALVAAAFLILIAGVVLSSLREWILLLARRKLAVLRETEPVWLPDYALAETNPLHFVSLFALLFALAKELSGEAQMERVQEVVMPSECCDSRTDIACLTGENRASRVTSRENSQKVYLDLTEKRFQGVRRCC